MVKPITNRELLALLRDLKTSQWHERTELREPDASESDAETEEARRLLVATIAHTGILRGSTAWDAGEVEDDYE